VLECKIIYILLINLGVVRQ